MKNINRQGQNFRFRLFTLTMVTLLCFAARVASAFTPDTYDPGAGWTLVWGDEFNNSTVNTADWNFDTGGGGWGNGELQTYTTTNAPIINGEMVITAIKNPDGTYTSARLNTGGKHFFTYGKMVSRIRLPYGKGIWPAFWTIGNNFGSVGWPACGEMDILEMIGGGEDKDDSIYGSIHWFDRVQQDINNGRIELPDPQFFYQDYHIFELEWNDTWLIWKLDGNEMYRQGISESQYPGRGAFRLPQFIILNTAVGGAWPGNPDATTVFPQHMYVDWVRVYQNPPSPTNVVASSGNAQVTLSWSASVGATSYHVKRGTDIGGPFTTLASPTTTSYTDATVANGSTYYYVVSAVNTNTESGNSAAVVGLPDTTPIYEAENATLSGAVVARNQAGYSGTGFADYVNATGDYVEWSVSAPSAGAQMLKFRYANGGSTDRPLELKVNGVVVNSSLSFPPTGGWTTWVFVSSSATFNSGNNTVRLTTVGSSGPNVDLLRAFSSSGAPPAPTGLTAIAQKSPGKIKLTWTQSSGPGITQNKVYRSTTGSGGPYTLRTTLSATTTYTDTGLTSGATYYYVVTAVNSGGESPYSNSVGATAK